MKKHMSGWPIRVACASVLVLVLHAVLVRSMAHGHIAHVLLGASNQAPPLGAAILATGLVVVRLAAVVLVPGALLAAAASVLARHLASSYSTGISEGAADGTSIGGRSVP